MAVTRLPLIIGSVFAWAACSFCSLLIQWQPAKIPLDLDEVYWIGSSYYYHLAFVQWDWTNPHWQLLPARENPPVAKYVIGLGLAASGRQVDSIDGLSYFYLRWLGWDKNPEVRGQLDVDKRAKVIDAATPGFRERLRENGRLPLTRPFLQVARNTVVVCAVLSSLLLFLLGATGVHWLAGLVASQLLLLHPIVVSAYHHAMADTIVLMLSLAAALASFCWFRYFSNPQRPALKVSLALTFLTGAMLAFACGAKMNSLTLVLLTGLLVAFSAAQKWLRQDRSGAIQAGAHGVGILASALIVFVAINPAIVQNPMEGLAATVMEHHRSLAIQADLVTGQLTGLPNRFATVVALGFFGWIPFLLMTVLVAWCAIRQWHEELIRFAVCWWLVTLVIVTLWIPFAWSRYIIPVVPPSVLLIGYLFQHIILSRAGRSANRLGAAPVN